MSKKSLSLLLAAAIITASATGCQSSASQSSQQSTVSFEASSDGSSSEASVTDNSSEAESISEAESTDTSKDSSDVPSEELKQRTFDLFTKKEGEDGLCYYYLKMPNAQRKQYVHPLLNEYTEDDMKKFMQGILGDKYLTDEDANAEISALIKKAMDLNMSFMTCFKEWAHDYFCGDTAEWHEADGTPLGVTTMEELYDLEKSIYSDISSYEDFMEKFGNAFKFENNKLYYKTDAPRYMPSAKCWPLFVNYMSPRDSVYRYATGAEIDGVIKAAILVTNEDIESTNPSSPLPEYEVSTVRIYADIADIVKTDDGYRIVRDADWSSFMAL